MTWNLNLIEVFVFKSQNRLVLFHDRPKLELVQPDIFGILCTAIPGHQRFMLGNIKFHITNQIMSHLLFVLGVCVSAPATCTCMPCGL